ncbi:hypothetical protein C8J57DRAFT_1617782 [Mycena rebaudengoi]|nr:hypothetical protein C8J57DRAFT_1617782 [Mycena rebaudengoi]
MGASYPATGSRERVYGGGGGVAVCDTSACERRCGHDGAVRPGNLLADAAIHNTGCDAARADGEDLYFYTLASSPVSSASTSSSSAMSESCSASEESTSEEEEGYDAPAYTERTTPSTSRRDTPPTSRRDTPPTSRRDTLPPPPTSHNPARIDRWLRVVPADPSAHAHRPQQQSQQPQPQYGCIGGGGYVGVGRAEHVDVACAGGRVVTEVLGGGTEDGGVSGWGTAAAVDAPERKKKLGNKKKTSKVKEDREEESNGIRVRIRKKKCLSLRSHRKPSLSLASTTSSERAGIYTHELMRPPKSKAEKERTKHIRSKNASDSRKPLLPQPALPCRERAPGYAFMKCTAHSPGHHEAQQKEDVGNEKKERSNKGQERELFGGRIPT